MNPKIPMEIIAYTIPTYPNTGFRANVDTICDVIPKAGKIKMYTSGCPKNQNKCWYKIGSPPPAGSKNEVLKFRSVNNIVIAPANTGKANNNKIAVMKTAHTNNGNRCIVIPGPRMLMTVVMKFTAPKIELAPAKCKLKIPKSTAPPGCPDTLLNGGYTVHPTPGPTSTNALESNNKIDGGNNQKLMLFNRGNAISGAPIIKGTNQFPYPPINPGITKKNTITNPCAVTNTLYNWWFPPKTWTPAPANSHRITTDAVAPTTPEKAAKNKYNVPMSLWFVEQNQRVNILVFSFFDSLQSFSFLPYRKKKENSFWVCSFSTSLTKV